MTAEAISRSLHEEEMPTECQGCTDCLTNGSDGEVCPKDADDPDKFAAEGDYKQGWRDENTLAANLAELVNGECEAEDFEKVWDPERTESFEEAGVLTSDEGFRFRLKDGRRAYVTVKIQSR